MLVRVVLPAMLLCGCAMAQNAKQPPLASIVTRMEAAQAQKHDSTAYELIRRYQVAGANSSTADTEVVAALNFAPPSSHTFTIQKSTGSSRGQQVVRHVLEQEIQAADKQVSASAVTTDNYNFRYLGEAIADGQPCYRLALDPKRRDKNLIAGEALVDQRTFQIRHIAGDLAKTPSWWLKRVRVEMAFADVQGNWLETSLRAEADVRIVGPHTLTSQLVDFRGADVLAMRSADPNVRANAARTARARRSRQADPAYSAVFTR